MGNCIHFPNLNIKGENDSKMTDITNDNNKLENTKKNSIISFPAIDEHEQESNKINKETNTSSSNTVLSFPTEKAAKDEILEKLEIFKQMAEKDEIDNILILSVDKENKKDVFWSINENDDDKIIGLLEKIKNYLVMCDGFLYPHPEEYDEE